MVTGAQKGSVGMPGLREEALWPPGSTVVRTEAGHGLGFGGQAATGGRQQPPEQPGHSTQTDAAHALSADHHLGHKCDSEVLSQNLIRTCCKHRGLYQA